MIIRSIFAVVLAAWLVESHAESVLIQNVTIHTLTAAGTLKDSSVLIEDGVVAGFGGDIELPSNMKVIDGQGKVITPGLFDPYSQLGVTEVDAVDGTVDGRQSGIRFTASFDVATAINPRSTLFPVSRVEGITHAMVAALPGKDANYISGLGAVIHLGGTGDFLLRRAAALFVQLGEKGSAATTSSRASAMLAFREALEDARDFDRNRAAYDEGRRRSYSIGRTDLEALQAVINREIPVVVTVNRASDIVQALDMAEEEDLWLIINGGSEAWLVADELKDAGVTVILDPTRNLPENFESLNASLESAARLHAAGVPIAFSISDTHNSRNLRQLAGNAVANGLPWIEALRAITETPASLFLGGEGVGSLQPGSVANLVVWDGDPLEVSSFPTLVYIDGKAISLQSRQSLLRDRYFDLQDETAPAYRKPGR